MAIMNEQTETAKTVCPFNFFWCDPLVGLSNIGLNGGSRMTDLAINL